jgi:hypothetical protein
MHLANTSFLSQYVSAPDIVREREMMFMPDAQGNFFPSIEAINFFYFIFFLFLKVQQIVLSNLAKLPLIKLKYACTL